MESGSTPPDRPGFGPGSPGYGPGGEPPPPSEPQSPAPQGPQSPSPGSAPASPPHAPPSAPETPQAPTYGGPVPPGGWQGSPVRQETSPLGGPLASWGSRLGAYLIDALVVFVPVAILFVLLFGSAVGLTGSDDDDVAVGAVLLATFAWLLLSAIVLLAYASVLMARKGEHNGQTWGKQLLGIRAVRDSGQPWSFGSAAFREVLLKNLAVGIASSIIPIIPWFLNFFWPLWDDQNRALHDMAASSHVVKA